MGVGGGAPAANRQQPPTSVDSGFGADLSKKGPLQGWPSLRPPAAAPQPQQPPLKDATMPLSPPLTPLPASIGRFPQLPMLGHNMLSAYNPFLLAAQNPFMPRPPLMTNGNPMELIQQLIQLGNLRNLGNPTGGSENKPVSNTIPEETAKPPSSTDSLHNNNNNNHVKNEEDLKREEEMVEDEMKEEEDEDELDDSEEQTNAVTPNDKLEKALNFSSSEAKGEHVDVPSATSSPNATLQQLQIQWLRKIMYDDLNKNKQQQQPTMTNSQQQDIACNNDESNQYEESLMSDGANEADFANGLNNSNSGDERKVRVRTLISDEQLTILKTYYNHNPRPKREELERISTKIGHPFKVVKVWFQNSRARDRREGKPVTQSPGAPGSNTPGLPFFMNGGTAAGAGGPDFGNFSNSGLFPRLPLLGPLLNPPSLQDSLKRSSPSRSKSPYSTASEDGGLTTEVSVGGGPRDQPLDLSNKGSSPSVSPLSTKDEDEGLQPQQPRNAMQEAHPNNLLEHFRRAAAAACMSSTGNGAASSVTASSVMPNLAFSSSRPLVDIYRFQEDLETSGSAGSGGATTDEEGRYTCEKCDKTFTKQSSLSRHKYEHSGRTR